jgi:hypothetical protein
MQQIDKADPEAADKSTTTLRVTQLNPIKLGTQEHTVTVTQVEQEINKRRAAVAAAQGDRAHQLHHYMVAQEEQ